MDDTVTIPELPDNSNQANRVYNLTVDLLELKQQKKDTAKGFNEEIKRIEKEISEILKENE